MANTDLKRLEEEVMLLLREDDDPPLIHVWWRANSLFPNLALSERLALAERTVAALIDAGRVQLVKGRWPDGPSPNTEPLTGDVQAILREYSTWVPETDGPMYFLTGSSA